MGHLGVAAMLSTGSLVEEDLFRGAYFSMCPIPQPCGTLKFEGSSPIRPTQQFVSSMKYPFLAEQTSPCMTYRFVVAFQMDNNT